MYNIISPLPFNTNKIQAIYLNLNIKFFFLFFKIFDYLFTAIMKELLGNSSEEVICKEF